MSPLSIVLSALISIFLSPAAPDARAVDIGLECKLAVHDYNHAQNAVELAFASLDSTRDQASLIVARPKTAPRLSDRARVTLNGVLRLCMASQTVTPFFGVVETPTDNLIQTCDVVHLASMGVSCNKIDQPHPLKVYRLKETP